MLYFLVSAVPELRSYFGISEDIRNRVGLKDRLFQLTAIFQNFKQAVNFPWDIPLGSGEGHFTQVSSFSSSAKIMQRVSWEVCASDSFPFQ